MAQQCFLCVILSCLFSLAQKKPSVAKMNLRVFNFVSLFKFNKDLNEPEITLFFLRFYLFR